MINYLIYIDDEGDISQIRLAKGDDPVDREIDPVVGQYCIHYMELLEDPGVFHSLNFWNYATEAWQSRLERPNKHAVWNSGAWTWSDAALLEDIRAERNIRLNQCDWTLVTDSPLTDSQKTEAATYRTALRRLTSSITIAEIDSVANTPWPTPPSFLA